MERTLSGCASFFWGCPTDGPGAMLTGSAAAMAAGGPLSPEHSRWLMGYPAEWGYGNAIVPPLAAEFVTAFLESLPEGAR